MLKIADSEYQKVGVQAVRLDELTVKLDSVATRLYKTGSDVRVSKSDDGCANSPLTIEEASTRCPMLFASTAGRRVERTRRLKGLTRKRNTTILQMNQCERQLRLTI